jgi:hypothetical protein
MDESDRNDIIKKIKKAGKNDVNNLSDNQSDEPNDDDDEPNDDNQSDNDEGNMFEDATVYDGIMLKNPKKNNMFQPHSNDILDEMKPCWKGYKQIGMKTKGGKEVPNCVPVNEIYSDEFGSVQTVDLNEAEYKGKEVTLGKPSHGDVKKFKVYVKNSKGNVIKVNFGDPNMEIKRDNPERRKSFRARHKCSEKKDRTKPGYWSCKMWGKTPVSKIVAEDTDKKHIFANVIKTKLKETFEDMTEPFIEPVTKPTTKPKEAPAKPKRRDSPFVIKPDTIPNPQPKANSK